MGTNISPAHHLDTLTPLGLPPSIRSQYAADINGLTVHFLEAGHDDPNRPVVLLLHGFPELAYSWRKIMPALAAAGYRVIAPDQRGYGRTTGWDADYDGDLRKFNVLNIVRDMISLVSALGIRQVHAVVGHDYGSRVAAMCALIRPDIFARVALLSIPFAGVPKPTKVAQIATLKQQLAQLARPRKDYQDYFGTREANGDMWLSQPELHRFLRGYYHQKSADNTANHPEPLKDASAQEFARLPTYYVMDLAATMVETAQAGEPDAQQIQANTWLPDEELSVYSHEFARTGFQGGLQCYRASNDYECIVEQQLFAGLAINVPALFIAGVKDWGVYKTPGELDRMRAGGCTQIHDRVHLLEGAGHWVQQEQPEKVSQLLIDFFQG